MKSVFFFALLIFTRLIFAQTDESVNLLKQRINICLPWISGWCSEEKASHFVDLVLDVKPKVCVEIGVFFGSSLFPVASALKFIDNGVVIGIDPWDKLECIKNYDFDKDKTHIAWWSNVDMDYVYNSFLSMLKNLQLEDYCIVIKKTAQKAILYIDAIDILYLDGNHSEASNILDVSLYLPKVVSGGYIWMNDTLTVQAQPAIDILIKECDIVKIIENGNCVLFKKR
ncbi:MAG TPA: class I SAM-dependent methyltransferase [Rhabdochlamydiaceae bacterium]